VHSVCRRYLREAADVEDAVQETFLKLARHHSAITGEVAAWLASTAASTSIDLIRSTLREQRRRIIATDLRTGALEHEVLHDAIRQRLGAALAELDDRTRELLIERFFRKTPLRVIAGRTNISIATVSRRAHEGLEALAGILRDMGVDSDDLTLAEHFGAAAPDSIERDGLRFAPDWRVLASEALASPRRSDLRIPHIAGWTRRIRVGAFLSHSSTTRLGTNGVYHLPEEQVWSTRLLLHPGFELVGIVEPGTSWRGPVERTLRDYELLGGLVDSTDEAALQTLDVILLGLNWSIDPQTSRAFASAVRSGVGLLNEYWTGMCDGGQSNQDVLDLMLADSPYYGFHIGPMCNVLLPATVHDAHPLLPGCSPGRQFLVGGCGPVYRVAAGAQVLMSKDLVIDPTRHRIPGLGPARMPIYVVGRLGHGRAAVVHVWNHARLVESAGLGPHYFVDLLTWLAEPHRAML